MFRITALILATTIPFSTVANTIKLPAGTIVYGELDQQVISKKKKFQEGDIIRAHVWRDVMVNGKVFIKAGSPMTVRISHLKTAKIAGIKGDLELEAVSALAIDGTEVLLDGGYDKSGRGYKALTATLSLVVFVPLIFIKGKKAVLPTGTVFDSTVQSNFDITLESSTTRKINLTGINKAKVEILYDEMKEDAKDTNLPLLITAPNKVTDEIKVISINNVEIEHLSMTITSKESIDDNQIIMGHIDLKKMSKHFQKGINRFILKIGEQESEVILDVEL